MDAKSLPKHGLPPEAVLAVLEDSKAQDYDWREGVLPLYVYWHSDDAYRVSKKAYELFFTENGMGKKAFPSITQMERDVTDFALGLLGGGPGAGGSLTSGGTESIFQAVKGARNRARTRVGTDRPRFNIVVPRSAHPAFAKAAQILDVDEIRVPIKDDFTVDVQAMEAAVTPNTIMLAGSAPGFPHGVFDDIPAIAALAWRNDIWMHVDACVGGMLAPFLRLNGEPVPDFDLSVPGVTSLSVDLHKYGYAAKGASLILVSNEELKKHYRFDFNNWPRGDYTTDTFLGTRPAGPVASAWAVMRHLGIDGYREGARTIAETKRELIEGIEQIPGLQAIRPTDLSFLLYHSIDPEVDINAVADLMAERGWFVGRSVEPASIHLMLNPVHHKIIGRYLNDLGECVTRAREERLIGTMDTATY